MEKYSNFSIGERIIKVNDIKVQDLKPNTPNPVNEWAQWNGIILNKWMKNWSRAIVEEDSILKTVEWDQKITRKWSGEKKKKS